MIDRNSRVVCDPDVVCTELETGEGVLLHLKTKACFTLNATGVLIWKLVGEGLAVNEMARRIAAEFTVDGGEAERDALELLTQLQAVGLVSASADDEPAG